MSYEQFLKQLRRIGKYVITSGAIGLLFTLLFDLGNFASSLNIDTFYVLFAIWTAVFLVGLAIYPFKEEE